jgi:hypothetical protein
MPNYAARTFLISCITLDPINGLLIYPLAPKASASLIFSSSPTEEQITILASLSNHSIRQ